MEDNNDGMRVRIWVIEAAHSIMMQQAGLDGALEKLRKIRDISPQDKAFAQHLLRLMLKNKTQYAELLQQFLQASSNMPSLAMIILYAGVAQIHHMNVPNYASVNTCVELAKHYRLGKIAGLVNAVLKKAVSAKLCEHDLQDAPEWLRNRLSHDYGEEVAAQIWRASLDDVNYVDLSFKHQPNMQGLHIAGQSLRMQDAGRIEEIQGYDDGDWWVQDLAASLPIFGAKHLLSGAKAIDLCAAPGGKTMQLAAFGAEVVAVDRSAKRLELLKENLRRTNLQAVVQHLDLLKNNDELSGAPYEFVVLDAPCTATGTLRRNPDILYQIGDDDVVKLCAVQAQLLHVASDMVASGGYLLYVVCSLFRCEGEAQIEAFLKENKDFKVAQFILPSDVLNEAGQMRTLPHFYSQHGGMDGFFAALLQRA